MRGDLGSALDYDGLAASGLDRWSRAEVEPLLRAAGERMRVRIPDEADLAPFHRASLASLVAAGVPRVDDLNDLDADTGAAPFPANIVDGVRWNAALAYLDPVRDRPSLHIAGDSPAERLVVEGGRVRGAIVRRAGEHLTVNAGRTIVCAGAYDSPALLLRSGIGPAADLRALGIPVAVDLPGVGANLHDHPAFELPYGGTPELRRACEEYAASGAFAPIEGVIAKLRSGQCAAGGFDLHIYPVGGVMRDGSCEFWFPVACMTPRSRGSVRLRSADGTVGPLLDHAYPAIPTATTTRCFRDGVEIARGWPAAGPSAICSATSSRRRPGSTRARRSTPRSPHYYHPAGTCAMGRSWTSGSGCTASRAARRRLLGLPGRPAREHVHPGGARGPPPGGLAGALRAGSESPG